MTVIGIGDLQMADGAKFPGIVIEASREELQAVAGNILYHEVVIGRTLFDLLGDQAPQPPSEYVRMLEKALEPVLAIEGAIEQTKRTDRNITCELDARLFKSLDAVAEAQKVMQKYREQEKSVAGIEKKITEAVA